MAEINPATQSDEVGNNDTGPQTGTEVPATVDPALAAPDSTVSEPAGKQVVYVDAPKPFVKKGNRGFGILIAIISTVIFAVVTAVADVIVELVNGTGVSFGFVSTLNFYSPVIMFFVGFVILVVIVNRAGWAAHVIGSIFVGLVTYFGAAGLYLVFNASSVPSNEIAQTYGAQLTGAGLIIAALLAREVSLWMGFAIASRGRKVKARNVDAKVLYDQEIAAKRAEYERANTAAGVGSVASAPEAPAQATGEAPVVEAPAPKETGAAETPAP